MKIIPFFLLVLTAGVTRAQSESYEQLRNRFVRQHDVYSFSVSGFWCRLFVGFMGEEDRVLRKAMQDVKHVRLMTIPAELWKTQFKSTRHFTRLLTQDGFEELATIRDQGDHVYFHMRSDGKWNRYFVLIEQPDEVVAIELKGYLDPALLKEAQVTTHNQ
ncbi:MAG: DUF4252 domain-containing protein [Cyclobacteriaceae bacterium]|nr:DUF4252 domain-containing protein [Cyclobacteriaceae bacterium]